jgi:hypothetical protein
MNTHEIVNLIVAKFGGNRVKFDLVNSDLGIVDFVLGHNLYRCGCMRSTGKILVRRSCDQEFLCDNYSSWVEGILNGMVRNEAGEMVTR